jgi:hypothetical protein
VANEVAAAGAVTDLDETAMLERAQRLTHRHPAGLELEHHLPLGGEPVAAAQAALEDGLLDLLDDVLVHARRAN